MNTKAALVKVIINNIGASDILKAVIRAIDKLEGKDIRDIILAIFACKTICYVCDNKGKLKLVAGNKEIVLGGEDSSTT